MKKIIFVCIIAIIIIGCSSNGPTISSEDVYQGTDGLVVSFGKGNPPPEVFENSAFYVVLELANKGAYDIQDGVLDINYPNPSFIEAADVNTKSDNILPLDNSKFQFQLPGRSELNVAGGQDAIGIRMKTGAILATESQTATISVNACYHYQSRATPVICIDTDPLGIRQGKKACEVQDVADGNGQGAPVSVTNVEVKMIPSADANMVIPQFKITIQNVGGGIVFNPNHPLYPCNLEPLNQDEVDTLSDHVLVHAELSRGVQLDCDPTDDGKKDILLDMNQKDVYVICSYPEGIPVEKGAFMSPLNIALDYGYQTSLSFPITVKKISAS